MADEASIEWVVDALEQYTEAKQEYAQARADYNGYSWGYAGSRYINAVDGAREELALRLNEYIDARVDARLKAMNEPKAVPHVQ